ncbi:hypothetical protein BSPWISOXPB_6652 [uncultured Gammaproteobacteria bacterium]|nr:hypothetical protein BSPWISOXPB_6652 [uncultured Gammaproteobacteria bacterium]
MIKFMEYLYRLMTGRVLTLKGIFALISLILFAQLGFSVPTMQEFKDEKIGLKTTFNNFLKLPLSGRRDRVEGRIVGAGTETLYKMTPDEELVSSLLKPGTPPCILFQLLVDIGLATLLMIASLNLKL